MIQPILPDNFTCALKRIISCDDNVVNQKNQQEMLDQGYGWLKWTTEEATPKNDGQHKKWSNEEADNRRIGQ